MKDRPAGEHPDAKGIPVKTLCQKCEYYRPPQPICAGQFHDATCVAGKYVQNQMYADKCDRFRKANRIARFFRELGRSIDCGFAGDDL